ncbi:beta-2-microglobulin-like [Xiphophorus maculatus]|uniref:Beta-2-microglobulin-like n=1 Tax=Xiphophorus maculatus TaxID=8083 RepID=M3ZS05_XIPMA|nr:beta-2-microglobulin-like [Xiphophorus maculatus]XP_023205923.1 beta-2-microglobulin-like [Xiphophorus maculatus]
MKLLLCLAALVAIFCAVSCKISPPKVLIYSRNPGEFGKQNSLICHVSNFHPPDITIDLLCDGTTLPNPVQTDLAFKQDWHFHLTKSATFTPESGKTCICRVNHAGTSNDYNWEPNM